jgi:hypothetical protein
VDKIKRGVFILKKYQKYFGMETTPKKSETKSF